MPTIDDEIRSRTVAFARDLTVLVRQAALDAVGAALSVGAAEAAPVRVTAKRGRGRPRKSAVPAPAPASTTTATVKAPSASGAPGSRKATAPKRAAGEKRPPAELAKLIEKLGEYIKAHPGLRMEVIAKAIGAHPRELRLPATKLVAAKKIRAVGQKRGTEYFPM